MYIIPKKNRRPISDDETHKKLSAEDIPAIIPDERTQEKVV